MPTEAEDENSQHAQALEDEAWALAAAEAEKSGYIGTEEAMRLLRRYAEDDACDRAV